MAKELPEYTGTIRFGKVHPSHGDNFVRIELTDEISRTLVAHIDVSITAFGELTSGSGDQPCTFQLISNVIGKTPEYKTEHIKFPVGEHDKTLREQALAPYEVGGWRATFRDDLGNMHKYNSKTKTYAVGFVRYV